jgi:hypothetical protein
MISVHFAKRPFREFLQPERWKARAGFFVLRN